MNWDPYSNARMFYFSLIQMEKEIVHMSETDTQKIVWDEFTYKNGLKLPTGQWYAPSAVIKHAGYCMVSGWHKVREPGNRVPR